jgi:hypothetical protein
MRTLTAQQKKLIRVWFDANYTGGYKFNMSERMDYETYEKIENLHPTEIHKQNVDHYLEELVDNRK